MSTPDQSTKPTLCPTHWDHRTVPSLYLMGMQEHPGYVKIGMADQPDQRLERIQVANPFTLVLLATRQVCCKSLARRIERQLHWRYRDHRTISIEWFRLPDDSLDALIGSFRSGDVEHI